MFSRNCYLKNIDEITILLPTTSHSSDKCMNKARVASAEVMLKRNRCTELVRRTARKHDGMNIQGSLTDRYKAKTTCATVIMTLCLNVRQIMDESVRMLAIMAEPQNTMKRDCSLQGSAATNVKVTWIG